MSLKYTNQHREIDNELAKIDRLHFESDRLEQAYDKQFTDSNHSRHRLSCIIAVVAVLFFAIQDLSVFPEESKSAYLMIRMGICLPFFIIAFIISQMPSMRKQLPFWVVTAVLLLGIGSVAIVAINHANNYDSPYEGIILTIIAAYYLVGLDFRAATMSSGLIVASYVYTALLIYQDYTLVYYNLSFVIITMLICAVGGYSVEKQLRINFLNKETLTILSQRDGLTGLYNRATLEDKLKMMVLASLREPQGIAFALIDIDFFKNYNDHYGHIKGDQSIKSVAKALQNCCKRPTDFCARYGGEEFVIVLFPTKEDSINTLAEVIQLEISKLNIEHKKSKVAEKLTVSGGLVYFEAENLLSNDDIFHMADQALYEAKEAGRDQFKLLKKGRI